MSDKKEAVSYLENNLFLDVDDDTTTDGETLENVAKKPANSKVSRMTVKCLSTSKIIKSPYGEYRIAKIRDFDNNKCDINLNKHNKDKMEKEKLYHIDNFKVSDYKADNTEYRRLATLPTTLIRQVGKMEENKYKHIRLGDKEAEGTCLGIGRTFGYFGCQSCWKKVEDEVPLCAKCNTSTENKTKEFSTQLYIEIDEEVLTFQAFRSQFHWLTVDTVEADEIEELLEADLTGQEVKIELNDGYVEEIKKLVKIKKKE